MRSIVCVEPRQARACAPKAAVQGHGVEFAATSFCYSIGE